MNGEDLIFALDIGTRTVVGLVLEPTSEGLEIIASEVIEHESRAMMDGQIHNVMEVARVVRDIKEDLEETIGIELDKVAVAAAGRALKTTEQTHFTEFAAKREITEEDVNTLELATVQKAQKKLAQDKPNDPADYHFVGYSVMAYRLDGMHIGNLVGQKCKKIEVDLITTFLPRIVVDSLISVIQHADLTVQHMTLEPIAASNVVIPKEMHNFNLALVDIGAGTSDIAITSSGAIVGYAMVPVAGDEITEALAENYLIDYNAGEKFKRSLKEEEVVEIKDILGGTQEIQSRDALMVLKEPVSRLANLITEEILALNQKSPQAVLCIGGGSLTPLLTEKLADILNLPTNRVGVKKAEDIKGVIGQIEGLASTQTVTPIGIAVTCQDNVNKTTFMNITLNDERINIFSLGKPTVSDALLASDTPIQKLYGKPGMALTFKVNGELTTIKGTLGQPGQLTINDEEADLDTPITSGDKIIYQPGQPGQDGSGTIKDIIDFREPVQLVLNETPVEVKTQVYMNNKMVGPKTSIEDRAEIKTIAPETYREALIQLLEVPAKDLISQEIDITLNNRQMTINLGKYQVLVNGENPDLDQKFSFGDEIKVSELDKEKLTIEDLMEQIDKDMNIEIAFNGRSLTIPTNNWLIKKNGERVTIDTAVSSGDDIICRPKPISFNKVLSHINYQLPETLSGKLTMTINGHNANYTDKVNDGDTLEIKIER